MTPFATLSKRKRTDFEAPAAQPSPSTMWLDMLPREICDHIAKFLTCGIQTTSALHLAETSSLHCSSILSVRSYRLVYPSPDFHRWVSVFDGRVRHFDLDLSSSDGILHRFHIPSIRAVLKTPTLRTAKIWDHPQLLRALAPSPSLRILYVTVTSSGPYNDLLTTLHSLHLLELHLVCRKPLGRTSCPFGSCVNLFSGANAKALVLASPHLRTLEICGWCVEISDFWPVLLLFPALRQFTVNDCLTKAANMELVASSSLQCTYERVLFQTTETRIVNSVHVIRPWRSPDAALSLARLPHLSHLTLPLECMRMMQTDCLPRLEQLRSVEFVKEDENPHLEHSVAIAMSCLVRRAPSLRKVQFSGFLVPHSQLSDIQKMLGPNLEDLGILLQTNPAARPEEYLAEVFTTAISYNRSLRTIEINLHSDGNFPGIILDCNRLGKHTDLIRDKWNQNRRLLDLLSRLQRHAINLDVSTLEECVRKITDVGIARDPALGRSIRHLR